MQVICLEESAFFTLVEQVVNQIKETQKLTQDRWLSEEQAMQLLNVKSKTTMQKMRDEGRIRYTQPQKKIILYDRESIMTYLDKNAKNIF